MTEPPWIVREHRREYRKVPPPPSNRIIYPESKSERGFELYITKDSMDRIMQHCNTYAEKRLEAMGFLIGDVYKWKGFWYTVVKDVVSSDLTTTNTSVRFDKRGFEDLFAKLENLGYDYIIVGWYHSHPGLGCFLSSKDIETQRCMFNSPFHSALVVDTINQEIEAYKLKREGYAKRDYAIYMPGKELP